MSQVKVSGNASGTGIFEIAAPNSNSNRTLTLPDATGTIAVYPQIYPISASVAANALTITLASCVMDMRSSTLGSGTVVTRYTSTTLSLTVPASATLGTVNATAARLVVLALDNAGTLELAVVNISGGTQLDETNLLTTTTISSGATSASTVYSTTGRTSVAYRVMGFLDITTATAGTWATAPSTIQGVGGEALTAMSSLGYGQTWQVVTGSRALSTTYYNTTGRPIQLAVAGYSSSASQSAQAVVNGTSVITSYSQTNGTGGVFRGLSVQTIIPPNASYQVQISSGTLDNWAELR